MEATANSRGSTSRPSVYLVDRSERFRRAQREALVAGEVVVIGESDRLTGRLPKISQLRPDVVLLDGDCGPGRVPDLAVHVRSLRRLGCAVMVLAAEVTSGLPEAVSANALTALGSGAAGYLLKDRALPGLAGAVRQVLADRIVIDTRVFGVVFGSAYRAEVDPELVRRAGMLSRRERQVMRMVAAGRNNTEIAQELELTVATVKSHVSAVLRTLQVRDRVQIAIAESQLVGQAAARWPPPSADASSSRSACQCG